MSITGSDRRRARRLAGRAALLLVVVASVVGLNTGLAYANAPNPLTGTSGFKTPGPGGAVNVTLNGTWSWGAAAGLPPQACSGRYGTAWAVDWWGISGAHPTPTPNFPLTNATEITSTGQGENGTALSTGTITSVGSIQLKAPNNNSYFHVPQNYAGQEIFTPSFCAAHSDAQGAPSGTWTAMATYPSAADIPSEICVNFYDVHGNQGKPNAFGSNDYSPLKDGDNSIQTNAFNPSSAGYCLSSGNLKTSPTSYLGYADSFRPGMPSTPGAPWQGSPNVTFVGCGYPSGDNCPQSSGSDLYDAGAIRFDNNSGQNMTFSNATVMIGKCSYSPWPGLNTIIPPNGTLILTQTGGTPPCFSDVIGNYNLDTSENGSASCTNDTQIPQISVTINGSPALFQDKGQILNTGGSDRGNPCPSGGGGAETTAWTLVS